MDTPAKPPPSSPPLPEQACCKGCDYLLCGLPDNVCPECGRPFDPADPRSYALATPQQRRRKLIIRLAAVAGIVALLFALVPRGIFNSKAWVVCGKCGTFVTVERWELKPPAWMPWRYIGFTAAPKPQVAPTDSSQITIDSGPGGTIGFPFLKRSSQPEACQHSWDIAGMARPLFGSGTCKCSHGNVVTINGTSVTPETIRSVLTATDQRRPMRLNCLPVGRSGAPTSQPTARALAGP